MGGSEILSGAQMGKQLFAALVAGAKRPDEPEPAFIDFTGIRVATASFLRESVIAFRDYARSTLTTLYPVIANATPPVTEEIAFFLHHRNDALWACDREPNGAIRNIRLLGELDDTQRATFESVLRLGEATAPALAANEQGATVGATAWNNRLSSLAALGLLMERRGGKTKLFVPVLRST